MGLGINSMEGREQKNQKVLRYAANTTIVDKWPQIFRHEFIQEVYLRLRGFDDLKYNRRQRQYIPEHTAGTCTD